jgi:hypothetical protein
MSLGIFLASCFAGLVIGIAIASQPQASRKDKTSGSMRSGRLFLRAPWAPHTCDDGCSLWPTPTASMDGRGFGIPLHHNRTCRYRATTVARVQELVGKHGWRIHPHFTETLMGFPLEWSATAASATPSSRKSRSTSAGSSSRTRKRRSP